MASANTLKFNIPEKLALVKMIYSVIIADRVVHKKEIQRMTDLTQRLNFDTSFIEQAQTLNTDESLAILDDMQKQKKQAVGQILHEVAKTDGFMHDNEMSFLLNIFGTIGIGADDVH
ncbi:TerB family tellurite resistance protein [Maribacter algarum]|uniref:TerB family tellurite resistance protein n=1 Tax=Maribacter algarum (ex Zhang et al. 2020) TaxID=2578118 RepID=A0A5S3QKW0_9FLAO|nr:TerB family tellurite resistance protein [Maribacter algarum]TMM58484.1 TerB family tellurite resistance protein [Maribacter algarum]